MHGFQLHVTEDFKQEGGPTADFINCVAFGKTAEFIEKYFLKGMKIEITGRIQTGSYTNQDGNKVYTTDVVAEQVGFGEVRRHLREHRGVLVMPMIRKRDSGSRMNMASWMFRMGSMKNCHLTRSEDFGNTD